ncbi:MAG: thioredoxin [Gammaproteobacteria bacterium SG8_31]|nr:MAG: thioredoxin [Gammaproteobacteria bacterium SG8_31]
MTDAQNRLAGETSPYLLQHADNPVQWYPWCDEALELAKRKNKPILLSIGYSACHWCHVMAHESFENPATAEVMNRLFVNIKVDREERPDLDKIYQLAHQMLVQRPGGWPLTMFLDPEDLTPFFGGTYFPDKPRHGMPAFTDLLDRVADYYRHHREDVARQADAVRDVFARIGKVDAGETPPLDAQVLQQAREALAENFDEHHGGFGRAPKFPHPTSIERLLRHWRGTALGEEPDLRALYMATSTLQRMALGGLYDQIGGGFCRYSVDDYWMIPHFEKMLYDNGPLTALYAQAWAVTNDPLFERVAAETADWVMREMQCPDGGYFSTLDADSEGEEGQFYVWDRDEIRDLLGEAGYGPFAAVYGLDRKPNFEGRWHLHTFRSPAEVANELGLDDEEIETRLAQARAVLLAARETRIRPARDEKILTAWNGLMIRGMAIASRHLKRSDFLVSAAEAAEFVRSRLWQGGRLQACWKDGRARFPAYLDDYAFMLDGMLELLQQEWRGEWLSFAVDLAEALLAHFEDQENGGFFFTSDDHEQLIHRPRPLADEALPSGNGVAAQALARLGYLIGETRYLTAAERTLTLAAAAIRQMPHAHCALLSALEERLRAPEIIIIRGTPEQAAEWQRAASLLYTPGRLVFLIPPGEALPEALGAKSASAEAVAYICRGTVCSAPVTSLSDLTRALRISA